MSTYLVVSHSHLDREWYRTAEALRNRLVDAVDDVLDIMADDPGFTFVLDGQTIVLEDYLELRPSRADELRARNAEGRLSFGPWYVQPDGFVPSAESIVRNLLEGRRVAAAHGTSSRVGYLPDTFGHPAQLPAILTGFGLTAFCFRRGADDTVAALPSEFVWEARDGSRILALYLAQGYSNAGFLPSGIEESAAQLQEVAEGLLARTTGDTVALMNGCDHAVPVNLGPTLDRLAERSGARVIRGSMDDVARAYADTSRLPVHRGELRGAREDALLPGTLSTRMPLKLANAANEWLLYGLAEPFAAISRVLGDRDDSPALHSARKELLANHAHDSLCGTSVDEVHREMEVRFRRIRERATLTAERAFSVISGTAATRPGSWDAGADLAIFNPHPYPYTGAVRHWFDADPPYAIGTSPRLTNPPLLRAVVEAEGLLVDGAPAAMLTRTPNERLFLWHEDEPDRGVEFVVRDLPPLGWSRVRLTTGRVPSDEVDDGRRIAVDDLAIELDDAGTFTLTTADRSWHGLLGVEELGDAGDSYDAVTVEPAGAEPELLSVRRVRRPDGVQAITTVRRLRVPEGLDDDHRSAELVDVDLETTVRLLPGTGRADVAVVVRNTARDHRIRLRFPLADHAETSLALGPYDTIERPVALPTGEGWVQDPPATFPAHGAATVPGSGLAVCAPGLLETEVTAEGELLVTLLRSIGVIGGDLPRRGVVAPAIAVPDAQLLREVRAELALVPYSDPAMLGRVAREVGIPLGCVEAGPDPVWPAGAPVLGLEPAPLVLSALKPRDDGPGTIVRIWNPGDVDVEGRLDIGLPLTGATSVRLDETPDGGTVHLADRRASLTVPAHGVRTLFLEHP